MNPAALAAITAMHAEGVGVREISAQTSIPLNEVREAIRRHTPPAASRDERLELLLKRAANSTRQQTRSMGERLRTLRDALCERLADEERKQELRDTIRELEAALNKARRELRANASKETSQ